MRYLKKASRSAAGEDAEITAEVAKILQDVESGGEQAARDYALRLDDWEGDIVVAAADRERVAASLPQNLKDDIAFAHDNVRRFANAQRAAILDTEIELMPGLVAGHRNIPVATAGCYVPGGRYTHLASAIMSVTTAKVAGVQHVIAACPPRPSVGINPAVLYALDFCGTDTILNLGGVQAIASLAFGLFTGYRADMLVGPGNQYVAEAKRILYGRVGIDMFAGPSEIMIIADASADPEIVAADLVGQAEHGYNSPAWLIALSSELAVEVMSLIPRLIARLPELNAKNAEAAWRDYGEILVADSREEAARAADDYAPEHLEVQCADAEWWLRHLRNYGSLFLGEETTVAFGDKTSGPNHILPTKGAARYTGGLSVGKFLKTVTWQRMTRDANRKIATVAARISRLEGMEAHARTSDIRLAKWFPGENFDLSAAE
jgi:sulfopropanediol 3-dehydrogenase